jgi:glycosyltransferase involved in cell wall biosynthesis
VKIIQGVGWYYPESLGGTEVYVHALSRRLREAGHEVLVAAPQPGAMEPYHYEHDGIPVFRYPIPRHPDRAECQGVVAARGASAFHDWLRRERPDVVHLHTFVTGLGLHELQVAKSLGARTVATTHSARLGYLCQRGTLLRLGRYACDGHVTPAKCAACALQERSMPGPAARLVAMIPPRAARRASRLPGPAGTALGMAAVIEQNLDMQRRMLDTVDRFVVLTEWAQSCVLANGAPAGSVACIPLGISQAGVRPKPGPDAGPTVPPVKFGYVGRFEAIKGVQDLARAWRSLPADLPARLEFRGPASSPADAAAVEQLRRVMARDPRVSFAPAVPPAEVPAVLSGYDVVCCPGQAYEGGPTVALEAFAVGTPVLGTRMGRLAELVRDGHSGRLVPPTDWRRLAGAILEIVGNPGDTIDFWRRALPPARTMDDVVSDYLRVYQTPAAVVRSA